MTSCRYPGCTTRTSVRVDADESWCRSHAKWEADRLLRMFVMQRDRHLCQRCGGNAHDAAHLIPRARAPFLHWQPFNVVALCRPCHDAIDASPARRQIWVEARWPMRLETLQGLEAKATLHGIHVDLGQVIRDFREERPPDEIAAAYGSGEWLG